MNVFNWNVTSKIKNRRLRRVKFKFRKKIPCTMQGTLKVATANDLDDLVLIVKGKGFLAVINGMEPEMDETLLEAEGEDNGRKLVLFN